MALLCRQNLRHLADVSTTLGAFMRTYVIKPIQKWRFPFLPPPCRFSIAFTTSFFLELAWRHLADENSRPNGPNDYWNSMLKRKIPWRLRYFLMKSLSTAGSAVFSVTARSSRVSGSDSVISERTTVHATPALSRSASSPPSILL